MSAIVWIDVTVPYPDLRPGDVIVGLSSTNGIVESIHVRRDV